MRTGDTVIILYEEDGNKDLISDFSLEVKTDGAI